MSIQGSFLPWIPLQQVYISRPLQQPGSPHHQVWLLYPGQPGRDHAVQTQLPAVARTGKAIPPEASHSMEACVLHLREEQALCLLECKKGEHRKMGALLPLIPARGQDEVCQGEVQCGDPSSHHVSSHRVSPS